MILVKRLWKRTRRSSEITHEDTDHLVQLLLQVVVPGLLGRHDPITEGLLAPPEDLLRDQVEAIEGVPQEELLHSTLQQHREKTRTSTLVAGAVSYSGTAVTGTDLRGPDLLGEGQVVRCEPVVQERCPELQPGQFNSRAEGLSATD